MKNIEQRIDRAKAELRTVKPRSRRRFELEVHLRDLMLMLLRRENRVSRRKVA